MTVKPTVNTNGIGLFIFENAVRVGLLNSDWDGGLYLQFNDLNECFDQLKVSSFEEISEEHFLKYRGDKLTYVNRHHTEFKESKGVITVIAEPPYPSSLKPLKFSTVEDILKFFEVKTIDDIDFEIIITKKVISMAHANVLIDKSINN